MSDDFTRRKLAWLDQLVRDSKITRFTFCVAFVTASTFLNRRSGTAWPSHKKLAALVNGTEEGVRAAIRQLVNAGYLERDQEARGRGHTNVYRLIDKNRDGHTGISNADNVKKTATAKPKNRDCHTEKPGSPSPQNPFKNPLSNPTGADGKADERATALPTGARARPPDSKQVETLPAAQGQNGGAAPWRKQSSSNAERQRCENQLADIFRWERLLELPPGLVDDLCRRWSEGEIKSLHDLPAEFLCGAPSATVMPTAGMGEQPDDADRRLPHPADADLAVAKATGDPQPQRPVHARRVR